MEKINNIIDAFYCIHENTMINQGNLSKKEAARELMIVVNQGLTAISTFGTRFDGSTIRSLDKIKEKFPEDEDIQTLISGITELLVESNRNVWNLNAITSFLDKLENEF